MPQKGGKNPLHLLRPWHKGRKKTVKQLKWSEFPEMEGERRQREREKRKKEKQADRPGNVCEDEERNSFLQDVQEKRWAVWKLSKDLDVFPLSAWEPSCWIKQGQESLLCIQLSLITHACFLHTNLPTFLQFGNVEKKETLETSASFLVHLLKSEIWKEISVFLLQPAVC